MQGNAPTPYRAFCVRKSRAQPPTAPTRVNCPWRLHNSAFSDGGGFSVFAPAKRVPTSENDALCKSRDNVRRVVSLLPQALQDLSRTTTLGLPARGVLGT